MITTQQYRTKTSATKSHDWNFFPVLLCAAMGVVIGLLVGHYCGWL